MSPKRASFARLVPGILLTLGWLTGYCQSAPAEAGEARPPQAPPPNPPVLYRSHSAPDRPLRPQGPTLYSIGDPTEEEQLYLEYINRARANPPAEGQRLAQTTDPDVLQAYNFFSVNLTALRDAFNAIAPAPPLSFHPALIQAARLHSLDMFTNQFQSHTGSSGSTLGSRLAAQNYSLSTAGENIYSYAEGPFYGHAGFEVDWGPGPDGMQSPPGHRNSIHNAAFREVGVGVVNGRNATNTSVTAVGPQLVTQDFGTRANPTPLITGVAYYDLDGDSFYGLGEGLGGVTVTVDGVDYYAVTANSGGYTVPVPGNGTYTVRFSGTNLPASAQTVTVSGGANLKLDLVPPYIPPQIQGPDQSGLGELISLTASTVPGATGYEWRRTQLLDYTRVDGAEQAPDTSLLVTAAASYSIRQTLVKSAGQYAFHLAHPDPEDQSLEFVRRLQANSAAQLTFASRLGWAGSAQTARLQISTDEGAHWADLWSREGTDTVGQTAFETVTLPLDAYQGATFRVRFLFDFSTGSYYSGTGQGVGWYIDELLFNDVQELTDVVTTETADPALSFTPAAEGHYQFQVRPRVSGRWLAYGPAKVVQVGIAPPRLASPQRAAGGQLEFLCTANGQVAADLVLESRDSLGQAWSSAPVTPTLETLGAGQFRFTVPLETGAMRLFRVRVLP